MLFIDAALTAFDRVRNDCYVTPHRHLGCFWYSWQCKIPYIQLLLNYAGGQESCCHESVLQHTLYWGVILPPGESFHP